jgi:hypothetical protein
MIPTRLLQDLSTAVLGACGVTALFAPEVLLSAISMAQAVPHWPVQLLASAWLALAMLDWMTRGRPGPIGVAAIFGVFAVAYGSLLFARTPAAGAKS